MSIARAILAAARQCFNNPALLLGDVRQVVGSEVEETPSDRAVGYLVDPGVTASVPSAMDRRGQPVLVGQRVGRRVQPQRRPPSPPEPKPAIPRLPLQTAARRV